MIEVEQKVDSAASGEDETGNNDSGLGVFVAVWDELVHRLVELICLGLIVGANTAPDLSNGIGLDGELSHDAKLASTSSQGNGKFGLSLGVDIDDCAVPVDHLPGYNVLYTISKSHYGSITVHTSAAKPY